MVLEAIDQNGGNPVVIYGPGETLACKFCGQEYVSRGKHDPGYCYDCEQKMIDGSSAFIGGPLNGSIITKN